MDEWISVKDRLPEYNKVVLISWEDIFNETHISTGYICLITRHSGEDSPVDDTWYMSNTRGYELKVTHWQPLPEPPSK